MNIRCIFLLLAFSFKSGSVLASGQDGEKVGRGSVPKYAFVHIPKTGGSSLALDLPLHLSEGTALSSRESCWVSMRERINGDGAMIAVLRSPLAHVYSQFLECKHDRWGKKVTKNTKFPRNGSDMDDFDIWLDAFVFSPSEGVDTTFVANTNSTDDFGCYHPIDMQTRYMSCTGAGHHNNVKSSLPAALDNLRQTPVVGIMRFYPEILCLTHYHSIHMLPPECLCSENASRVEMSQHHITHGVPKHTHADINNWPSATRQKVVAITYQDRQLYLAALLQFQAHVLRVEVETSKQFLCSERVQLLTQLIKNHSLERFKKNIQNH